MNPAANSRIAGRSGFIIDLDGVLWRSGEELPGAGEFIELLDSLDLPYVIATNEPAYTSDELSSKLNEIGISVPSDRIFTSGMATVAELRRRRSPDTEVLVIGRQGLKEMVRGAGFEDPAHGIQAVVVTMSHDIEFEELSLALTAINQGADFLAPNRELTYPTSGGLGPGDGMLVVALEQATGRTADVTGKPNRIFFETALRQLELNPEDACVIGDSLESDIAGARVVGVPAALLLTGMTSLEMLSRSDIEPDWVFADLLELSDALK